MRRRSTSCPERAQTLRHISVEVTIPMPGPSSAIMTGAGPRTCRPTLDRRGAGTSRASRWHARSGHALDEVGPFAASAPPIASSLVHDVNAVHGLLDRLACRRARSSAPSLFAGGDGGHGSVRLLGGAGAVDHDASDRAEASRLSRAHHALFRRLPRSSSNFPRPGSTISRRG